MNFNIGIIGVGKMGLSHLAIANQVKGIQVGAFAEKSNFLRKSLSKSTGIRGYADYREMIQKEDLKAVMICVPNWLHYETCSYCIDQELHFFVEKPFTLSHETSLELAKKAAYTNVLGQVGYVNRYNPIFLKAKDLLDQNIIGEVFYYSCEMTGSVLKKPTKSGWRNDYSMGGGCLYDYGSHCIDLALFINGNDVKVQSASLQSVFSQDVDDCVSAELLHVSGRTGHIHVNWADFATRKASNSMTFWGSNGKLIVSKQELNLYLVKKDSSEGLNDGWNRFSVTDFSTEISYYLRGEEFSKQIQDFVQSVSEKEVITNNTLFDAAGVDLIIEEIFSVSNKK